MSGPVYFLVRPGGWRTMLDLPMAQSILNETYPGEATIKLAELANNPPRSIMIPLQGGHLITDDRDLPLPLPSTPAPARPKVITLCGSSRFVDIMAVTGWFLERDERAIAMGLHLLPGWYGAPDHHLAEAEGVNAEMDALHLKKIEMSDEVFVINFNDYIGSSTRNEIAHAQKLNKPIRWFTHDPVGQRVLDHITARVAADAAQAKV